MGESRGLHRVHGIGSECSDLLEQAGVDTIVELARRNATSLYEVLVTTNGAKENKTYGSIAGGLVCSVTITFQVDCVTGSATIWALLLSVGHTANRLKQHIGYQLP